MNAYLTLEYRSPWAAVNSLWAAATRHGFVPDRIDLLSPDPATSHARQHARMLGALQEGLGKPARVETTRIDPEALARVRRDAEAILHARRMEGARIAVDLTPGRTVAKLALLQACEAKPPDHIFYLDVPRYDYRDLPYLRIPLRLQRSRDLRQELLEHG